MDYLPVFLDLRGRLALVVGGGAVAARKVELLLKAQAHVRVVAPGLGEELLAQRAAGRIEHLESRFEPDQLGGALLAIAATGDPQVNQAVAAAAAARGVWVNVVDDRQACSCIMPSIVDRAPVLVAISTSGRSPALARRLRAQLESLLPERLGALAESIARHRARVRRALPEPAARRAFWDRLLSGAFATAVLAAVPRQGEALLEAQVERLERRAAPASPGEVYLIGAGPGDPDLLTLRAQQLLQQADVVLYDRLVSPALLARARRDAERIYVGKEPGRHRATQQRIHALMLEHARRGRRVARLKGGDPFIFGRGGEELDALRDAGIPVTIVPGVTAALGAAAAAALPLTRRGLSRALCLVTAMGQSAEALDWRALAAAGQTVVFYMGVAQLPQIVERLQAHGAPGERPAAIIERATLPAQRVVRGTLSDIAARADRAHVEAPALLVVGEVVRQDGGASGTGLAV